MLFHKKILLGFIKFRNENFVLYIIIVLKILQDAVNHVIRSKNSEALALLADYEEVDLTPFCGETGYSNKVTNNHWN